MRFACAALVAAITVLCAPASAQQSSPLTLDEAFRRALSTHPEFARFRYQRDVLDAELAEARLRPQLTASAEIENAAGTGATSGLDQAELTLSLASVLERGDKRAARIAVAQRSVDGLTVTEEARRLDVLAEVARRYLDVVATQELARIADEDVQQRERTIEAAAQRVRAGASPDSTRLTAVAAAARARLDRERIRAELQAAKQRLASSFGERIASFEEVRGDLSPPLSVPTFDALASLLDKSPELTRFADERRLREARLQLAQASRSADWEWQIGVRRLEETQDWAAVAALSIPLGTRSRAAPAVRAAQAELADLELERSVEQLSLHATLSEAHARLSSAATEVALADKDVLPALEQAETAAERAYRAGALSYLEWAQVQAERSSARRERLGAALQARKALIEIQRLTGEPFVGTPIAAQP
jgi:cobalt-zinc-cadmium efflux system outer membrane protein